MSAGAGSREKVVLLEELRSRCGELWQTKLSHSAPESPVNALWEEHLEIRRELDGICKLQEKLSVGTPKQSDRQASLDAFMNWCDRMQIRRQGVTVKYFEEIGFELQTTKLVNEGDDMICVPRNALFSWDQARKSALLRKGFERDIIIRTMDNVALALMLCCQKLLPDSYWHPYFDVLPDSFDTPLYFTEEELQALRPSSTYEDSLLLYRNVTRQFLYFLLETFRVMEYRNAKRKQQVQMQEPTLLNSPLTPENFTFDLYRWSVACVSTRVNMIPSQDLLDDSCHPVMIPCLIPLLDMANHEVDVKTSPPSVYFSVENDCASITAVRKYHPMQTVRIYYGKRSSSDFLLHNGFVPENENIDDSCKLKFGFSKNSELYSARLKMMQDYGYTTNSNVFFFDIGASEPCIDDSLFYFARVFVLDTPGDGHQSHLEDPVVLSKAWNFLRKRLELAIVLYGDLEKVEAKGKRQMSISNLKRNEVAVLQRALRYCDYQIEKVAMNN